MDYDDLVYVVLDSLFSCLFLCRLQHGGFAHNNELSSAESNGILLNFTGRVVSCPLESVLTAAVQKVQCV